MSVANSAAEPGTGAVIRFDASQAPESERLAYWIDQVCDATAAAECEVADRRRLRGLLEHQTVADLSINRLHVSEQAFRRTPRHVGAMTDEVFALVLVRSGEARVEMGSQRVVAHAGDLLINPGNDPGVMQLSEGADLLLTVVAGSVMQHSTGHAPRNGVLHLPAAADQASAANALLSALLKLPRHAQAQAWLLRDALLSTLASVVAGAQLPADDSRLAAYHRTRALQFITQHLTDASLNVPTIAAGIGLSVSQLHRLFPAASGSVMGRVRARRIEVAKSLLQQRAAQPGAIASVGFDVGFQTAAHFTRVFKSQVGLAPREWLESTTTRT